MKVFKTTDVSATTREVLVTRKCDLCGRESDRTDWNYGYYKVDETEIKVSIHQKEGHTYPDNGSGTEYEIDLCPTCFKDRFVKWLKSEGAKVKEIEWDY